MNVEDLLAQPVVGVAAMLRDRRLGAVALTEACLDRIDAANGRINALLYVDPETALAAARDSEQRHARGRPAGPLDGLPLVVKDNIEVAGMPVTNGMAAVHRSRRDAVVAARLRAGGAVLLGKANMDEAALGATGTNPHHGAIENPDYAGYSVGGSSGGSAAAVAAGFCPAALGTDTLGSVRLPAAYCGLTGFKPTHGLLSARGVVPLFPQCDAVGLIARSVADIVHLMAGLIDGWTGPEERSDVPLRWGIPAGLEDTILTQEVHEAFGQARSRLTETVSAGFQIRLPRWEPGNARRAGLLLAEHDGVQHWPTWLQTTDNAASEHLQSMLEFGRTASSERLQAARECIEQSATDLLGAFTEIDLLILPTTPQTPFKVTESVPSSQADFTALANFAGCPAISLPCPVPSGQSPVGLQLISAPGSDRRLLELAGTVERCLLH